MHINTYKNDTHALLNVILIYTSQIHFQENDAYECVVRDVVRGDKLSRWSRDAAAHAERCLALAAAALLRPHARSQRDDEARYHLFS